MKLDELIKYLQLLQATSGRDNPEVMALAEGEPYHLEKRNIAFHFAGDKFPWTHWEPSVNCIVIDLDGE